MAHRFVVKIGGELLTFDRYEDIPELFDHLIEFRPDVPPPPHIEEQHFEISLWNGRLTELLEREKRCQQSRG